MDFVAGFSGAGSGAFFAFFSAGAFFSFFSFVPATTCSG